MSLASLTKKIGQLKQWTGEKMGQNQRTETSHEFKMLEQETLTRRDCLEKLQTSVSTFHRQVAKEKEVEKNPKMPLLLLSAAMRQYSSMLGAESEYAKALIQSAQVHEQMAGDQSEFASFLKNGFLHALDCSVEEYKDFELMRKKLENRRLDFDAKLNRVQKSKKEKLEWEEEARVSQAKYEETLGSVTEKMIELNNVEPTHFEELLSFVHAELEFHRKAAMHLEGLNEYLLGLSKTAPPSTVKATPVQVPAQPVFLSQMKKPSPPKVPPSRSSKQVVVMFDFDAEGPGELTIRKDQVITVTAEINEGWWEGYITTDPTKQGMFPVNYCQVKKPTSAPTPTSGPTPISAQSPFTPAQSPFTTPFSSASNSLESFSCSQCSCDGFVAHAFKAGYCNACFHKH